jgi:hypothetical protein
MERLPISEAPRDGTLVLLSADTNPEYGEHLMYWSQKNKRWECKVFAPLRVTTGWWDEECNPPTHYRVPPAGR